VTPASERPRLLYPGLLLGVLIAAGTYLVAKRTLQEIPPLPMTMIRFTLASSLMSAVLRWKRRPGAAAIERGDRRRLALAGVLLVPVNAGLFAIGIQYTKAAHAALLYALTPAAVMLLGVLLHRRLPSPPSVAGVAVAFAGVAILLFQRGLAFDPQAMRGDLIILVAVFAWAGFTLMGRRLTARYGAVRTSGTAVMYGTLAFLPFGLWGLASFDPRPVSAWAWGGILYMAWLTAALNFVLWYWGVKHLSPAGVAVFSNLQPLFAALLAWLLLREALTPGFWLSTGLVLLGVWIVQRFEPSLTPARALASTATDER
jgi:drug/metabolite transporter (DMT)-like permease